MKTYLLIGLKLAVAVALAIPTIASASILASDGFESDSVARLSGQGGGVGWTGNWGAPGANTGATVVDSTANPLIFFLANGLPVDGGGC